MGELAITAFVLPLVAALVLAAGRDRFPQQVRAAVALAAACGNCIIGLLLVRSSAKTLTIEWIGGWNPHGGHALGIAFVVDPQGAVLSFFASVIVLSALLFSWSYFKDVSRTYHILMLIFLAAMAGFCLSADAFNIFVLFELMSAVAFALTAAHIEESSLAGAFNFGVTNSMAALFMLTGLALLYGRTRALNLGEIGGLLARSPFDLLVVMSMTLVLCGLLIKGAIVPFHFWLADAHAVAATPVCVIFSGVMVSLWLYGATHMFWLAYGPAFAPHLSSARSILMWAGALTTVTGALMSISQRHIKRMLAFSTISHMGIVMIGFAVLAGSGSGAAVYYILGHGLVKAPLFLCAGILIHRFESVDELWLFGRARHLRLVAGCWFVAALLLADLPPFAPWLGTKMIERELEKVGFGAMKYVIVFGAAMTGAAVLRAGMRVFLGRGHDGGVERDAPTELHIDRETASREPLPLAMIVPVLGLLAGAILLPLWHTLPDLMRSGSAILQDHRTYAAAVLSGRPSFAHSLPSTPFPTSLTTGIASVLIAIAAAAAMLRTRITELSIVRGALKALGTLHSGKTGDYVAMAFLGIAAYGLALWLLV